MTAPTLSVLMTVHNGRRYLPAALDSILGQSFTDFELIVMDDGSTDGTWDILAGCAARDRRVSPMRNETNLGIVRSMNRLFPLARGRYVTRHDADDLSLPERFARQVAYLDAHPEVGALGARVQLIDGDGAPLDLEYFPPVFSDAEIQQTLLESNPLCQGAVMLRREPLQAAGLYDESLEPSEDYDLWLRLGELTRFACLPERLVLYRFHPASISHKRRAAQMLHAAEAVERALRRRHGPNLTPAQALPAARQYLRAALACYEPGDPLDVSRRGLARALALAPALLAAPEPLDGWLTLHMPNASTEAALAFVRGVFDELLPRTAFLRRLRAQRLADLHMRAAFADFPRGEAQAARAHLWRGLWHEPRWLLNRGVLSIAARTLLGGPAK